MMPADSNLIDAPATHCEPAWVCEIIRPICVAAWPRTGFNVRQSWFFAALTGINDGGVVSWSDVPVSGGSHADERNTAL